MRYALLICTEDKRQAEMSEDEAGAQMAAYMAWGEEMGGRGVLQGGERLRPDRRADHRAGPRRRGAHVRRPVRGDQGADGRLLPGRLQGPRRGHRGRVEDPGRTHGLDRGAADLGDVDRPTSRSGRPCVPGRVGPRRRHPHPDHGRLGPRRGVRAGRASHAALERWPRDGVPRNPGAWLTTTARNRAFDRLRRAETRRGEDCGRPLSVTTDERTSGDRRQRRCRRSAPPDLHLLPPGAVGRGPGRAHAAHPRRSHHRRRSRVRSSCRKRRWRSASCGRSARSTTPASRTACRLRTCCRNAPRAVLAVLYLLFNEGYAASSGAELVRGDLAAEAIRLTRTLTELMPDEPEARGLLALMLLHDARRAGRTDADGRLVLLEDQDRSTLGPGDDRGRPGAARPRAPPTATRSVPSAGRDRRVPRDRARRRATPTGTRSRCSTTSSCG